MIQSTNTVLQPKVQLTPLSFSLDYYNSLEREALRQRDICENKSKSHTCNICSKTLSSPASYYVHMKQHSNNKPFHCNNCDATFSRKTYLEVHLRTHTGEKPFQCEYCQKKFTQKSSLNTHKRSHTGARPYSCDICDKRFAVKSYVTAHRWSHVNSHPLECNLCKMTFTVKSQFALHVRNHSTNIFQCKLCGRGFAKNSYLIRHQSRIHGFKNSMEMDNLIKETGFVPNNFE